MLIVMGSLFIFPAKRYSGQRHNTIPKNSYGVWAAFKGDGNKNNYGSIVFLF